MGIFIFKSAKNNDQTAQENTASQSQTEEDAVNYPLKITKTDLESIKAYATDTKNQMLKAKASNEIEWINKVASHANGNFAVIKWNSEEIKGDRLLEL